MVNFYHIIAAFSPPSFLSDFFSHLASRAGPCFFLVSSRTALMGGFLSTLYDVFQKQRALVHIMKHTSDACFVSLVGYRLLKLILKESSNATPSESNTETLQGEGTLQWIFFCG